MQEADDVDTLTPAMVTESYENFLGDVSYLADHERLNVARPKADADAAVVLEAVAAEAFIERLSANSVAWIQDLIAAEATESVDATEAAVKDTPLQIENTRMAEDTDQEAEPTSQMAESTDQEAEPKSQMAESTGPIPPDLLEDALLGGIVETIRQHVLRTVWPLLAPRHQPEETARRLDVEVRRELRAFVRMEPRRERHQKNPKVALPVTSLERLTGNPDLGHLFIRLSVDGKMLFIEDYEDGNYIDIFELHKNTKRQMHARAKDRARAGDTGELQTGSSYLSTLGRTNKPFAQTEGEMKSAFVLTDEGDPMVFPIF